MGTTCADRGQRDGSRRRAGCRALAAARREVTACERALSRFDPQSDLSRLNRAGGSWVTGRRAARRGTAGCDPRAEPTPTDGSTRRFSPPSPPPATTARSSCSASGKRPPIAGWRAGSRIDVDSTSRYCAPRRGRSASISAASERASPRRVRSAPCAQPGRADRSARRPRRRHRLLGHTAGRRPLAGGHRGLAQSGRLAGTLELEGGGVATSGRDTRRFGPGGRLHHLIDPDDRRSRGRRPALGHRRGVDRHRSRGSRDGVGRRGHRPSAGSARWAPRPSALLIPEHGEPIVIGSLPLAREPQRSRVILTMQGGRLQ